MIFVTCPAWFLAAASKWNLLKLKLIPQLTCGSVLQKQRHELKIDQIREPARSPPRGSIISISRRGERGGRVDRERQISTLRCRSQPCPGRSVKVKGFGCRPVVTYPRALRVGVRKPPRKEPAGAGRQLAVYGDLTMQRLALWMRWPAQSAADRRLRWRVWRDRGSRQGNFSLIDGIGRAVGGGGATAMRRRKRGSPVGGRCNEAVTSVMVSWP
jgi:hypothetical protein